MLAVMAATTSRLPVGALLDAVPTAALAAVALLYGLAAAVDLVVGKLPRFAARARRISRIVAPATGAAFAAGLAAPDVPLPLLATGAALLAWLVDAMVGTAAARASRSPAWAGLGHIPVLLAATTTAAVMVPLAVAKLPLGYGVAVVALAALAFTILAGIAGGARLVGQQAGRAHRTRPFLRKLASLA